jgi:tetratricopeptide (TPR) repeat protein
LVRDAVAVEEIEPLTLKGKAEPVPAYRLVSVSDATAGVERRQDAPMVGRERELTSLTDLFSAAAGARDCRMATVIGDAGVGKSRLIAEFTAAPSTDALVIRGRCLPYGEGITFWPLREAARDAAGIGSEDPPEEALLKLSQHVGDQAVADRLASVIGLSETPFPVPEVFWAARRFLEDLGRKRPVLLVVDDIHWAEATFLELIGHLVESVEESPVVVLCSSRHELLDAHPDWAVGERMVRVVLQPLTDADAGRVVEGLLGGTGIADEVRARIVQSAAGNPLFVEQLLSMLIDEGALRREAGEWVQAGDLTSLRVPPTIEALLAARLDLLDADGRQVIEPASVVGQNFAQAAVAALVPERLVSEVPDQLEVLARRQLVQPNPSHDSDEVAYRFQHLLVRDAAYGGLLKRSRAELHERFVDWAEGYNVAMGLDNRAFEEIHGYHLEQAYRYLAQLGTVDAHAVAVGERASAKLASAGRRAMARGDGPAAANLLRRASSTLPVDSATRGHLLPRLAEALLETGEFEAAKDVLVETRRIARLVGDPRLRADGVLVRLLIEAVLADQGDWAGVASREVRRAIAVFEKADDHAGLALAYRVLVYLHATPGRYGEAAQAAQQVVEHARIAEDRRLETRGITGYVQAALLGPTPVAEALSVSEQLVEEAAGDRRAEALIRLAMAQLRAMLGDFAEARGLYESARVMLRELGPGVVAASTSIDAAQVEILAGDLAAAEAALLRDEAELETLGEQYVRSTVAGLLARMQALQGRQAEADATAERVRLLAAEDDVDPQIAWRTVRAQVLLGRGEIEAARTLIAEAVALSRQADNPRLQAIVLADAGDLAWASGDHAAAESSWAEAVGLYERKGDRASAAQLRARMRERAGSGDPTRSVSRSRSS